MNDDEALLSKPWLQQLLNNEGCGKNGPNSLVLEQIQQELGARLPDDYLEFLRLGDTFDGSFGESRLVLFPVWELVAANTGWGLYELNPELIIFCGDGGGERFAFDARTDAMPIVLIPMIAVGSRVFWEDAIPCGSSFEEFLEHQYKRDYWPKIASESP